MHDRIRLMRTNKRLNPSPPLAPDESESFNPIKKSSGPIEGEQRAAFGCPKSTYVTKLLQLFAGKLVCGPLLQPASLWATSATSQTVTFSDTISH